MNDITLTPQTSADPPMPSLRSILGVDFTGTPEAIMKKLAQFQPPVQTSTSAPAPASATALPDFIVADGTDAEHMTLRYWAGVVQQIAVPALRRVTSLDRCCPAGEDVDSAINVIDSQLATISSLAANPLGFAAPKRVESALHLVHSSLRTIHEKLKLDRNRIHDGDGEASLANFRIASFGIALLSTIWGETRRELTAAWTLNSALANASVQATDDTLTRLEQQLASAGAGNAALDTIFVGEPKTPLSQLFGWIHSTRTVAEQMIAAGDREGLVSAVLPVAEAQEQLVASLRREGEEACQQFFRGEHVKRSVENLHCDLQQTIRFLSALKAHPSYERAEAAETARIDIRGPYVTPSSDKTKQKQQQK
jgi:hypothetical protein